MPNNANIPFRPTAFPFFYGWVIVVVATIGTVMSVPGQTIGVSVFTDFLIDALSLTRVQLSLAYMIGTALSAALLSWGGRLLDRHGARSIATAAVIGLSLLLVYMSFIVEIADGVTLRTPFSNVAVAFALVTVGFFGIRFFGQGLLTLSSRNMVMNWFDRRRGLANAILGVAISLGFSLAPRLIDGLIAGREWQGAWRVLALIVGPVFLVCVLVFYRNAPEPCGLLPDGSASRPPRQGGIREGLRKLAVRIPPRLQDGESAEFTLAEARRTPAFWVFVGTATLFSLTITAFTFHIVSIFDMAGMSRSTAVGIFVPVSVIAMGVQFVASAVSDYLKLRYLLLIQLAALCLMLTFLALLPHGVPLAALIVAHAISGGLFGVIANITWVRYFGRSHLGAISGFAMAFQVIGSAVGPYAFSVSLRHTGGYGVATVISAIAAAALFIFALRIRQPQRTPSEPAQGSIDSGVVPTGTRCEDV